MIKKYFLFLLLVSIAFSAVDWPKYHFDSNNTGVTSDIGPVDPFSLVWSFGGGAGTPIAAGGKIYVGGFDQTFYAFNLTTGNAIWAFSFANDIPNGVAYGAAVYNSTNNTIFFAAGTPTGYNGAKVYALNATNGAHLWNYTASGTVSFRLSLVQFGELLITQENFGNACPGVGVALKGLNVTSNGTVTWSVYVPCGNEVLSPVIDVSRGRLYIQGDNIFYEYYAINGTHVWNYSMPIVACSGADTTKAPALAFFPAQNLAYTTYCEKLYALNISATALQRHVWNYTFPTIGLSLRSGPAYFDDKVFISGNDGRLYGLNATNGSHMWNYSFGSGASSADVAISTNVVVGDSIGVLYFAGANITLHYPRNGTIIKNLTASIVNGSAPVIYNNNLIVSSGGGATLYVIGTPPIGSTPRSVTIISPEADLSTVIFLFIVSLFLFSVIYARKRIKEDKV